MNTPPGQRICLWWRRPNSRRGCTLSDGTQVEVWWDGGHNTYRLPDGTELLWEDPPETNFSTYYVEGEIPLTALPPALLEGITACYQERGALYDIQEEVERAYQAYRQSEDPEQFSYFLVEQRGGGGPPPPPGCTTFTPP